MHLPPPLSRIPQPARSPVLLRRGLMAAAVLCAAAPLAAQPERPAWAPQGAFIQAGSGEDVGTLTAGLTWPWQRTWRLWGGQLGGYWEASLSRWNVGDPGAAQRRLNQGAFTPVFRWRPRGGASPWFAEGAIGLTYTSSRYENGDTRFSTRFNFGDHLALGRSFGPGGQHELMLRLQHFSNGGVRKPNPGEDFVQLRYALHFD